MSTVTDRNANFMSAVTKGHPIFTDDQIQLLTVNKARQLSALALETLDFDSSQSSNDDLRPAQALSELIDASTNGCFIACKAVAFIKTAESDPSASRNPADWDLINPLHPAVTNPAADDVTGAPMLVAADISIAPIGLAALATSTDGDVDISHVPFDNRFHVGGDNNILNYTGNNVSPLDAALKIKLYYPLQYDLSGLDVNLISDLLTERLGMRLMVGHNFKIYHTADDKSPFFTATIPAYAIDNTPRHSPRSLISLIATLSDPYVLVHKGAFTSISIPLNPVPIDDNYLTCYNVHLVSNDPNVKDVVIRWAASHLSTTCLLHDLNKGLDNCEDGVAISALALYRKQEYDPDTHVYRPSSCGGYHLLIGNARQFLVYQPEGTDDPRPAITADESRIAFPDLVLVPAESHLFYLSPDTPHVYPGLPPHTTTPTSASSARRMAKRARPTTSSPDFFLTPGMASFAITSSNTLFKCTDCIEANAHIKKHKIKAKLEPSIGHRAGYPRCPWNNNRPSPMAL